MISYYTHTDIHTHTFETMGKKIVKVLIHTHI